MLTHIIKFIRSFFSLLKLNKYVFLESYIKEPFIIFNENNFKKIYISIKFKKFLNEKKIKYKPSNLIELILNQNPFLKNFLSISKETEKPIKTFIRFNLPFQNNDLIEISKIIEVHYNKKEKRYLIILIESLEYENLFELIEELPTGIIIHQNYKIIYANRYSRNIVNEKRPYEIIGKSISEFVTPEYQKIVSERVSRIINKTGFAEPIEEKLLTVDKKSFNARVNARKIIWNNEPAVIVFFENIDQELQRKNFLNKLLIILQSAAKNEDTYHLIKELLLSFQIIINGYLTTIWIEGDYTQENFINKIIENSLKIQIYSTNENDFHINNLSYFLIHPEIPFQKVLFNKKISFERNITQKIQDEVLKKIFESNNIKTYWCIPLLDSQKMGRGILICYFESIVKFKDFYIEYLYQLSTLISLILEKEKMGRENYILSEIIRDAKVGIIVLNKNFEILFYNNLISIYFPELFIRENFSFHFLISQLNIRKIDKEEILFKITNESFFQLNIETDEEDENQKRYFNFIFLTLNDKNNRFICYYTIIQEITETIQKEKELIKAKNESEKNARIKSEFLSVMSHEIRTPLNVIVSITNLLKDNREQVTDEHIDILKNSSEYLLKIINNILDFSRIENNKIEIEKIPISLFQLLKEIENFFKIQIKEKNLTFISNFDENIPKEILCDPTKMNQILFNIISNSIKFTDEGKVEIKTTLLKKENHFALIRFEITDTGIGIPSEKLNYIFEPFSQLDTKPSRKIQGTGLGLSITKKLVEFFKGTIQIESEVNKGTKVIIELPFEIAEGTKETRHQTIKIQSSIDSNINNIKILVVEDYLPNLLITKKFLEIWNMNVDTATNGEEAIYKTKHNQFDIILMDLYMPEMDGFETSKSIRKFNQEIPIIAITASSYDEVKENLRESGINDIIIKPFQPNELLKKINEYVIKNN